MFFELQFHGTSISEAHNMMVNGILVNKGGGELGIGFYTGDLLFQAFNWAQKKHGVKNKAVFVMEYNDDDFLLLNVSLLSEEETISACNSIKRKGETRSFRFKRDAILAPVVGKKFDNFNQIKYESKLTEKHINKKRIGYIP